MTDIALSPDDRNLYIAGSQDGGGFFLQEKGVGAVLIFRRDPATGALSQLAGAAGCINKLGDGDCQRGRTLGKAGDSFGGGISALEVARDGHTIYAPFSDWSDDEQPRGGIAVFTRDPSSGALTQASDSQGCISDVAEAGCAAGRHLGAISDVALSPGGWNLYAVSFRGILAAFARDRVTGELIQLARKRGCLSISAAPLGPRGCGLTAGTNGGVRLAVSHDGGFVYAFGQSERGVLARNPPVIRVSRLKPKCSRAGARLTVRTWAQPALTALSVTLDRRPIATAVRNAFTIRIPARQLRAPRHRLRITAVDSLGHGTTRTRTIRECPRPRAPGR